jgi:serine O-acetyltransferase
MAEKFNKEIGSLVATIASSYKLHPSSQELSHLPSRDVVVDIIRILRELLFPGYFGKQIFSNGTIAYHIGELLVSVHEKLYKQIVLALTHQALRNHCEPAGVEDQANEISRAFLGKIPEIRDALATDVQATFDGDPASENQDEIIFSYPGIFAVSVYRLAHELYLLSVPMIPRIMTEYAHGKTGIDIHAGAQIGRHFFIDHGTGVVIGETTVGYSSCRCCFV